MGGGIVSSPVVSQGESPCPILSKYCKDVFIFLVASLINMKVDGNWCLRD